MSIINLSDHLTCPNYEKGSQKTVELLQFSINKKRTVETKYPLFLFVLEGEMVFSCDGGFDCSITKGEFTYIPDEIFLTLYSDKACMALLVWLENRIELCDCPPQRKIVSEENTDMNEGLNDCNNIFTINKELANFIQSLYGYVSMGIKCRSFLNLKVRELLYVLYFFYPGNELAYIFHPHFSADSCFKKQVKKNSQKFRTVTGLAESMNYSSSGFQKKFKKVFGVAPYQWMKKQRSRMLYEELRYGNKNFKEICDLVGFSSPTYLNDYCRENFGKTPGEIRNSMR